MLPSYQSGLNRSSGGGLIVKKLMGPEGLHKKLQNLDSTQLNLDLGNAHIKSIIYLFQEAEHALKDSSVTKSYEHYNSS
jgi:hypothetical protein